MISIGKSSREYNTFQGFTEGVSRCGVTRRINAPLEATVEMGVASGVTMNAG